MNISIKNKIKRFALKSIFLTLPLGGVGGGLLFFTGCSNIDEDSRYVLAYEQKTDTIKADTTKTDTIKTDTVVEEKIMKNVLIEDFTGQKCVNCPNATDLIHEMQTTYGSDRVVAVAIHSGAFGIAYPKGLMTTLGTEYWNHWFTSEGQPIGKVNRGAASDYTSWVKTINEELTKQSDVKITVNTTYDDATKQVIVNSELLGKTDVTGNYQLWLTEDSIIAPQYLPDGSANKTYVHNHVLRDAINGSWGEAVTFNKTAKTLEHKYTVSDSYVAKNCHIVAFVYDTNGVKQVISVPVIK